MDRSTVELVWVDRGMDSLAAGSVLLLSAFAAYVFAARRRPPEASRQRMPHQRALLTLIWTCIALNIFPAFVISTWLHHPAGWDVALFLYVFIPSLPYFGSLLLFAAARPRAGLAVTLVMSGMFTLLNLWNLYRNLTSSERPLWKVYTAAALLANALLSLTASIALKRPSPAISAN